MPFDPAEVAADDGLGTLSTAAISGLLQAARDQVVGELTAVGDDVARWRPAPEEWSANECLGHIIEADRRGFGGRIGRILTEDGIAERGWDQVAIAAARRDNERSVAAILDEFVSRRNAGIVLVEGLRDEDLQRHAVHERVGRVTVENLLHEWVFHDRNHIRQLLANTQARAWVGMGNARRFSHPDR